MWLDLANASRSRPFGQIRTDQQTDAEEAGQDEKKKLSFGKLSLSFVYVRNLRLDFRDHDFASDPKSEVRRVVRKSIVERYCMYLNG